MFYYDDELAEMFKKFLEANPKTKEEIIRTTWNGRQPITARERHPLRIAHNRSAIFERKIVNPSFTLEQIGLLHVLIVEYNYFARRYENDGTLVDASTWTDDVTIVYEDFMRQIRDTAARSITGQEGGKKTQANKRAKEVMADPQPKQEEHTPPKQPKTPPQVPDDLQAAIDTIRRASSEEELIRIARSYEHLVKIPRYRNELQCKLQELREGIPF